VVLVAERVFGMFVMGIFWASVGLPIYAAEEPAEPAPLAEGTSEPSATAGSTPERWQYWISTLEEYRYRSVGVSTTYPPAADTSPEAASDLGYDREIDQDARLFFDGTMHSPDEQFSGEFSLGLWWDLNGVPDASSPTSTRQLWDAPQPWFNVFNLHADYQPQSGVIALARAGRQIAPYGEQANFDGVYLLLGRKNPRAQFFMMGGRTVHFFERDTNLFEDYLTSLGTVVRPTPFLRMEVDYRYTREDRHEGLRKEDAGGMGDENTTVLDAGSTLDTAGEAALNQDALQEISDHSYGVKVWFRHQDWLYSKAYLRGLNRAPSHVGATTRVTWLRDGLDLGANLAVHSQLVTLGEINEAINPYYIILGSSLPNMRWLIDVWQGFELGGTDFRAQAGWNRRKLLEGTPDQFNRNAGQGYLMYYGDQIEGSPFYANLRVDVFYGSEQLETDGFTSIGGAVGHRTDRFEFEGGSYYQQFKYDYYDDVQALENVRTSYIRLGIDLPGDFELRVRYEFERMDRDVHDLSLTLVRLIH